MEFTHSKRNIFVVADDLGLDPAVNEGIFFAFKNGLIDGASLMANGASFEHAIAGSKETPDLKLGTHLVLVEEKSLLGRSEVPTLLNTKGLLHKNHRIFFIRYVLGLITKNEIEKECEAQIQKILEAGVKPQFINSHQHLHLLPGIMDITIYLAKKYGISHIRIIREPLGLKGSFFRKAQLIFLNFLSSMAKKKISRTGLWFNNFFVGFINAGNLSLDDLGSAKKLQEKNKDKFVELGCHPGLESTELITKYGHWKYNWQKELEILKNTRQ